MRSPLACVATITPARRRHYGHVVAYIDVILSSTLHACLYSHATSYPRPPLSLHRRAQQHLAPPARPSRREQAAISHHVPPNLSRHELRLAFTFSPTAFPPSPSRTKMQVRARGATSSILAASLSPACTAAQVSLDQHHHALWHRLGILFPMLTSISSLCSQSTGNAHV